jgi:hypothetical protein
LISGSATGILARPYFINPGKLLLLDLQKGHFTR